VICYSLQIPDLQTRSDDSDPSCFFFLKKKKELFAFNKTFSLFAFLFSFIFIIVIYSSKCVYHIPFGKNRWPKPTITMQQELGDDYSVACAPLPGIFFFFFFIMPLHLTSFVGQQSDSLIQFFFYSIVIKLHSPAKMPDYWLHELISINLN